MRTEFYSKRKTPRNARSLAKAPFGFTLAELIVVITVLAILATVGFVALSGHLSSARDSSRAAEVGQISRAVELSAVRNGKYPMPVAAEGVALTAFAGGVSGNAVVTQWAATAANVRDLGGSFGKGKQTGPFVYSVLGDGAAYQVAAEFENGVSRAAPGIPGSAPEAYAASKTAYVEGNYLADPSLPSLIVSSGSVTGTWLFSPDACFVTDGGPNLYSANSGCVPKKSLALKSLDPGLVGYWDMETLCVSGSCGSGNDGKLADLSGNGLHGTSAWTVFPTSTGSVVGKWLFFSGGYVNIDDYSPNGISITKNGSFSFIGKGMRGSVLGKRTSNDVVDYQLFYEWGVTPNNLWTSNNGFLRFHATTSTGGLWIQKITTRNYLVEDNRVHDQNWPYYQGVATFDNGQMKLYVNGRLMDSIVWQEPGTVYSDSLIVGTWSLQLWARKSGAFFTGILDEIKIYSKTLSKEEILQQAKVAGF